ncbi:MAG: hypothetical protein ACRDCD_01220 [Mycoplasmoidaceae bacterium]
MNKKIKVTLLTLMLGASLAGIATTIVSCSASSSNQIKIEKSSTLEKEVTDSLTKILEDEQDYEKKRRVYNNIINNDVLPDSTLRILKNGIKLTNDGSTISWDDAVSKLNIEGPRFTQVAKGEIDGISIKLVFNSNYIVHDTSLSNVETKTGKLGKVGTIPILKLTEQTVDFNQRLSNNLTRILEEKRTYQEMKKTYDSWISDPLKNLPNSIMTDFISNFRFDTSGGSTLSFIEIVDNIKFESQSEYPKGVEQKVPDFKITIILKEDGDGEDDYIFTDPSEKDLLTIPKIEINAKTKPIDTSFASVNNAGIEDAFFNYLNAPNNHGLLIFQEIKQKFDEINNGAVPAEIKNAISQNVQFNFPEYEHRPINFDDVIDEIKISFKGEFPKTADASLPNVSITFVPNKNFVSTDNSLARPFEINLSRIKSGIIKYNVIKSPSLVTDFQRELSNHLNRQTTWQGMKNIYDSSWNSFDNLPDAAKKVIKDGITFAPTGLKNEDLDSSLIEKSNSFDNIISNITLRKGQFPLYGAEIPSVNLELTMIQNAIYEPSPGNWRRDINVESGAIGQANKHIAININIDTAAIRKINEEMIQPQIGDVTNYSTNRNKYNTWNEMKDLGTATVEAIKKSISINTGTYPESFKWDDIVDKSKEPKIIKPEFPNEPGMVMNNFSLEVHLNDKFVLSNTEKKFVINFGTLLSRGSLKIDTQIPSDPGSTLTAFFTSYINKYLMDTVPTGASKTFIEANMRSQYVKLANGAAIKNQLNRNISYINSVTKVKINNLDKFDEYFDLNIKLPALPPENVTHIVWPQVTIELTFKDSKNLNWTGKMSDKTLVIVTSFLNSIDLNYILNGGTRP